MHVIFGLKDTYLSEPRQHWRGRKVVDRRGCTIGRVSDILVKERSLDEVARQGGDPAGPGVSATHAAVQVGPGRLGRVLPGPTVLFDIERLREDGAVLRVDEDLTRIRLALAPRRPVIPGLER